MQVSVLYAGFTIGVCGFGVWLVLMLRKDRAHRHALAVESHERTRAHRRAALDARYTPPSPRATVTVARVGAFCRVPGSVAHSKQGAVLVCEASATGRPRWRRAQPVPAAG
jgi:hypothetical protein